MTQNLRKQKHAIVGNKKGYGIVCFDEERGPE